jgi:hypothetical protein
MPIELSGTVRGAATHRPDQAASHHGRAVGGASASRNRRFESVPLQRRVSCEPEAGTVTVGIFALGPTGLTGSQERAEYPATPGLTRRMSVKSRRKEAH